jgi:predicted HTH domain antitoxin
MLPLQINITVPANIAHAMQLPPTEFERKARMALASKLYEMGQISSHAAAQLVGLTRATFLFALNEFNTPFINTNVQDLNDDIASLA